MERPAAKGRRRERRRSGGDAEEAPPRKRRRRRRERSLEDVAADDAADEAGEERPAFSGRVFCKPCGAWRKTLECPVCGADLDPAAPEEVEGRAASRRAVVVSAGEPTTRDFLRVAVGEVLPSLPGAAACLLLVWPALGYQLPGLSGLHWPGLIVSSFVCTFWLMERTRAARTDSADLDLSLLGGTLLRTALVFPLLAGLAMSAPGVQIPVALVLLPILPLLIGALSSDDLREFLPGSLWAAYGATESYGRFALFTTISMAAALFALGAIDEDATWRAPVAVLGITVAGTLAGLARRSAEHMPDEDA